MAWFESMDLTDWVQVITQIVTTVIAVVMGVFAYKTYLKGPEQESEPEKEIATTDQPEQLIDSPTHSPISSYQPCTPSSTPHSAVKTVT